MFGQSPYAQETLDVLLWPVVLLSLPLAWLLAKYSMWFYQGVRDSAASRHA